MNKNLSQVKQRLLEYIDNQCIKRDVFFQKVGLVRSNFSGVGAVSELGGEKIIKILNEYENINPEWLLTGKGAMLRQPQGSTCGQVEEVQLSAAQEGAYKAKYYELLEQHVALQAKYAALLEEQQKNKSE